MPVTDPSTINQHLTPDPVNLQRHSYNFNIISPSSFRPTQTRPIKTTSFLKMAGHQEYYGNQQQYGYQQYPPHQQQPQYPPQYQYNAPPTYAPGYPPQQHVYRHTPRQNWAVTTARSFNIVIPVIIIILSIWWSIRSSTCPTNAPIGHECSWRLWASLPVVCFSSYSLIFSCRTDIHRHVLRFFGLS